MSKIEYKMIYVWICSYKYELNNKFEFKKSILK